MQTGSSSRPATRPRVDSRPISSASPGFGGRVRQNLLPTPTLLTAISVPPINVASLRLTESPRPIPSGLVPHRPAGLPRLRQRWRRGGHCLRRRWRLLRRAAARRGRRDLHHRLRRRVGDGRRRPFEGQLRYPGEPLRVVWLPVTSNGPSNPNQISCGLPSAAPTGHKIRQPAGATWSTNGAGRGFPGRRCHPPRSSLAPLIRRRQEPLHGMREPLSLPDGQA